MNNFHDLIVGRRSIRRYKSEEIPAEDVKTILEAALLAPTSKNLSLIKISEPTRHLRRSYAVWW
ncbi:MAG: nitroreductase family protein, partial [Muribaculum sp.]|nr:nitroreductase family protein [Muribaculum sp.]